MSHLANLISIMKKSLTSMTLMETEIYCFMLAMRHSICRKAQEKLALSLF